MFIVDLGVSYLLDQHSLILKLFLASSWKLYVGRIQTGHIYLHPLQVSGRSWRGLWLGVHARLLNFIVFSDLKYPSRSLLKPYFFLFNCVYHIHWISVHWFWNFFPGVIEIFQWAVSKPDIRICFPCRFVEVCGVISLVVINTLIVFNTVPQVWPFLVHLEIGL